MSAWPTWWTGSVGSSSGTAAWAARSGFPEPVLRTFEQRLRTGEGREELDAVEAALESFAGTTGWRTTRGRLQTVVVTASEVRLAFDVAVEGDVPPARSVGPDPAVVRIERSTLGPIGGRRRGARQRFPTPTLVTVGRSRDELVMVNLEGVGSVVLAGDAHANESVGRAMALELRPRGGRRPSTWSSWDSVSGWSGASGSAWPPMQARSPRT